MAFLPSYLDDVFDPFFKNNYIDTNVVFSISVVIALWTASKGIQNLTIGLNKIFDIKETRSWLKVRVISTLYMLLMIIVLVLSLGLLVWGNHIYELMMDVNPRAAHTIEWLKNCRMWILFAVLVFVFYILLCQIIISKKPRNLIL